jgi:hypothetical protein
MLLLTFTALGCNFFGTSSLFQDEADNSNDFPSDFELWSQGKLEKIQLTSGQENIDNFREKFLIQLTGQDENGISITGSQEYTIEIEKKRERIHEMDTIIFPGNHLSGKNEWARYDGQFYHVSDAYWGGRKCEVTQPEDTSHLSDVTTTRMLRTIVPGEKIEENVLLNGIMTDVFSINDLDFFFITEVANIEGKVWISQDPAFFVKAEGTFSGLAEFEYVPYSGDGNFKYEVYDFDMVKVRPPTLCSYLPRDFIPIPKNAEDIKDFGGLFTYSVPESATQVLEFYTTELSSLDWQVDDPTNDHWEDAMKARTTTVEGIQFNIEIKIATMANGSLVKVYWLAEE